MNAFGTVLNTQTQCIDIRVFSRHATCLSACFFSQPRGQDSLYSEALTRQGDTWFRSVPLARLRSCGIAGTVYYGLRVWGPNWPYDPAWTPGSAQGFLCDCDDDGNRFNPNKLLIDPYALEISHDPAPRLSNIDPNEYADAYYTGANSRNVDTASIAPKGIVLENTGPLAPGPRLRRSLERDVIYEVHVRGFTKRDEALPEDVRGTYRGAGMKAAYLRQLGVTAVEFLPVHAFADEQNDDGDPRGDNYWGYMTLNFFSPNRRYSSDKSPGGPTREFREMVHAFHAEGIKVILDVVYNHTAEGILRRADEDNRSRGDDRLQDPDCACLVSWRGIDNASYYILRDRLDLDNGRHNQRYQDNSACGGALNVADPVVRGMILESLQYWSRVMGVDGFRFDLAPVLGNASSYGCFQYAPHAPNGFLREAVRRLPGRSALQPEGVDLIAEPWGGAGEGTYQLSHFPDGWSEWNDQYRKTARALAKPCAGVRPCDLADIVAGSERRFRAGGRKHAVPANAINYVSAHDGYTLRDAFSYNGDEGYDHGGNPAAQRQAVRNAFCLLAVSAGTPMIQGGDEIYRTLGGVANAVALDNPNVYLIWSNAGPDADRMQAFVRNLLNFRLAHPCLSPAAYFRGDPAENGRKDIAWHSTDGSELEGDAWNDSNYRFLAWRVACGNGEEGISVYVACNWREDSCTIALPATGAGCSWRRRFDTDAWMELQGNAELPGAVLGNTYEVHSHSMLICLETN